MVHIANAGPKNKGPIFFNVDHPVGQGQGVEPNAVLSADVQLVQVMLRALGYYSQPGGGCSGRNDYNTVQAITQFQLNHTSAIPDGRIPARAVDLYRDCGVVHYRPGDTGAVDVGDRIFVSVHRDTDLLYLEPQMNADKRRSAFICVNPRPT